MPWRPRSTGARREPLERRPGPAPRWSADGGHGTGGTPGPGTDTGAGSGEPAERVLLEDHDGLFLLRPSSDETLDPADVADLARTLHPGSGTVTIVATAPGGAAGALWPRLSELLDTLRAEGTRSVRLVMAGAGDDRPERPALARRIADSWELVVEAPDGQVLVVPGGSVFVPPGDGGWWRFAPGEQPELLGPRTPAPDWQPGVHRVPARMADGCVVDRIPAGLLIRPAGATASRPGDVFHAIPVDHQRPAVVVGVPWGEDVAASEVAELLITLPAAVRSRVRLAPGGRRDVLRLGQSVAWMLKAEVEVTTGLPLFAAERPLDSYGVRSVLVGADGAPVWVPFVDAVLCPPAEDADSPPPPRLLHWAPPLEEIGGAEDGVVLLSERWQATATRAGLWVGARDGVPPPNSVQPVSGDGPVVEIGRPGERLDSSLWPVLSRLLETLTPALRDRTALQVHATPLDGGRALRTLAADQGLRIIRFAKPQAPRPASQGGAPLRPAAPRLAPARRLPVGNRLRRTPNDSRAKSPARPPQSPRQRARPAFLPRPRHTEHLPPGATAPHPGRTADPRRHHPPARSRNRANPSARTARQARPQARAALPPRRPRVRCPPPGATDLVPDRNTRPRHHPPNRSRPNPAATPRQSPRPRTRPTPRQHQHHAEYLPQAATNLLPDRKSSRRRHPPPTRSSSGPNPSATTRRPPRQRALTAPLPPRQHRFDRLPPAGTSLLPNQNTSPRRNPPRPRNRPRSSPPSRSVQRAGPCPRRGVRPPTRLARRRPGSPSSGGSRPESAPTTAPREGDHEPTAPTPSTATPPPAPEPSREPSPSEPLRQPSSSGPSRKPSSSEPPHDPSPSGPSRRPSSSEPRPARPSGRPSSSGLRHEPSPSGPPSPPRPDGPSPRCRCRRGTRARRRNGVPSVPWRTSRGSGTVRR